MRTRVEPFGAWVMLDEPRALVAIDRARARRLGLDGGAAWAPGASAAPSAPLEAHVAVTSRCGAGCPGCYLDATPEGASPPFEEVAARLDALAAAGVFTVAFGGGEPLARADLGRLAAHAASRGLSVVMTTSGIGMSAKRAEELRAFEQVNVSYDGVGEDYARVRGFDGAAVAERAMGLLRGAGVRFGVNIVLTRLTFGGVFQAAVRAASLGAVEAQLLRFKPAGRGRGPGYYAARLDEAQVAAVPALLERLVREGGLRVRVDCAMVPFLVDAFPDASRLALFGVFGCEAGRHLAGVTVDGAISPCSFAPPTGSPVGRLLEAFGADPELARFRDHQAQAPEPCASCALRPACRGGCRIVAAHAGDPSAPDPECPRVRRHQRGGGAHAGEGA